MSVDIIIAQCFVRFEIPKFKCGENLEIRLENAPPKAADFFENKFGEYAAERGDFFEWGGGLKALKNTDFVIFCTLKGSFQT